MVLLDKIMNWFQSNAAIVNDDEVALRKEVEILQKWYDPWIKIWGFRDYKKLFIALHLAKAKKNPFTVAFIRDNEPPAGELILKKEQPSIKIYKYSDTQRLILSLPTLR